MDVERPPYAIRACAACKEKKLRCQMSDGPPWGCTRCVQKKLKCFIPELRPRIRRKKAHEVRIANLERNFDRVISLVPDSRDPSIQCASTDSGAPQSLGTIGSHSPEHSESVVDGIDRVVSIQQAEQLVADYRDNFAQSFPYVILPKNATFRSLRHTRPVLLLAILATTSWKNKSQLEYLDQHFLKTLSTRSILHCDRDLDTLNGLLVYLNWIHLHMEPRKRHAYRLMSLAVSMAVDFGITQRPGNGRHQPLTTESANDVPDGLVAIDAVFWGLEARRAYLGCYYIAIWYSIITRKTSPMIYNDYLHMCAQSLLAAKDVPSDTHLIFHLEITREAEKMYTLFNYAETHQTQFMNDEQIQIYLDAFTYKLQDWRSRLPPSLANDPSHKVWPCLFEALLREVCLSGMSQSADMSISRTRLGIDSLKSTKEFFDAFLAIPAVRIPSLPSTHWAFLGYFILVAAAKSLSVQIPGWNIAAARSIIKLDTYIDEMSVHVRNLSTIMSPASPVGADKDWYGSLWSRWGAVKSRYLAALQQAQAQSHSTVLGLASEPPAESQLAPVQVVEQLLPGASIPPPELQSDAGIPILPMPDNFGNVNGGIELFDFPADFGSWLAPDFDFSCFVVGDKRRADARAKRWAAGKKRGTVNSPSHGHSRRHSGHNGQSSSEADEDRHMQSDDGDSSHADEQASAVLITTPEDYAEQEMARTALDDFFTKNIINSDTWRVPDHQIRSIYAGSSICNLSHLISDEANDSSKDFLHFPFPNIRPVVPWGPHRQLAALKLLSPSATRDIGAFPARDVRDDLIEAYFTKIHPGFPIVDEAEFRCRYNDRANPPPLLLFQSVLLAGSHVCEHPKVAQNRAAVLATFFRRAKTLFNLRYENDRTHMVQAALLFCWHFEGADDASANEYYWVGVAARMASAMGMHRDLSAGVPSRIPLSLKRIYRRLWWTIVQFDTLSSLHHGYPTTVNLQDSDQPMLCEDDFVPSDPTFASKINKAHCIRSAELCLLLASGLRLSSPVSIRRAATDPDAFARKRRNLVARLLQWSASLPSELDVVSERPPSFWALQLHLHYHMILLHMYRLPNHRPYPDNESSFKQLLSREDAEVCRLEAVAMETLLEKMAKGHSLKQCWFSVQTAMLAVAIQLEREIRFALATKTYVLCIQARGRLCSLLPIMSELSGSWPATDAILRRFQRLYASSQLPLEEVDSAQLQSGYDSDNSLDDVNNDTSPEAPGGNGMPSQVSPLLPGPYTESELRNMFEGHILAAYSDPEFLSSENLLAGTQWHTH